jgi:hypothetical protein
MADQYMSLSTCRSFLDPTCPELLTGASGSIPQPTTLPVIRSPSANYPHSDDDDGDDAVSSSSNLANTLSTPPPHRRRWRVSRRVGASLYAAAPVPPGIVYLQGIESNGLPVPPPGGGGVSGGGTPRSGNAGEGGSYTTPGTSNQPLSDSSIPSHVKIA